MDKTLDTLRRLREARQHSARAHAQRQSGLVAHSQRTLHTAHAQLAAQLAAKAAVGSRVAATLAAGGSARELVEAAHENTGYRYRIDDARVEVADARSAHGRAEAHLTGLHRALHQADANHEKVIQAAQRADRARARRDAQREEALLDETALRRFERAPEHGAELETAAGLDPAAPNRD
jgi:hypothetical protein